MSGTVLVVDDDPAVRDVLAETLAVFGYEAAMAANGAEALDWLAAGDTPCLILLDLMMPVMDGHEFLQHWGRDPRASRVPVVVSSAGAAAAVPAAPGATVAGVLPKPVDLAGLERVLRLHC